MEQTWSIICGFQKVKNLTKKTNSYNSVEKNLPRLTPAHGRCAIALIEEGISYRLEPSPKYLDAITLNHPDIDRSFPGDVLVLH